MKIHSLITYITAVRPGGPSSKLLLILALLAAGGAESAEMRSYAYKDLLTVHSTEKGKQTETILPAPNLPGVVFFWPRTKVSIDLTLVIEQQVVGDIETKDGKEVRVTTGTNFVVRTDTGKSNVLAMVLEEDPDLAFYLSQQGGFFTDTKDSKIQFIENSGRLSQVGVQYQDKTGQFISAVVKLVGETAGLVLGTQVNKSTDIRQTFIERSVVDGFSHRILENLYVTKFPAGSDGRRIQEIDLEVPMKQLRAQLDDRLIRLKYTATQNSNWAAPSSATLTLQTTSPVNDLKATTLMASAPLSEKRNGTNLHYFTGVPYRIPGAGNMTLALVYGLDTQKLVDVPARIPEAGTVGWLEFKSKALATISPNVEFDAAGGIKVASFSRTASADELVKVIQQTKDSVATALEESAKAEKAKQAAETAAKAEEAEREFKIRSTEIDIRDLTDEIDALQKDIAALTKPEDKDARAKLEAELRGKKRNLELAEIRLKWLKNKVEIKS